jgi:GNAT superfamily N-acetyltransferase
MGFNFRAAAKGPQLGFEHEEEYNGGSKRPDTHTLHGVHPETGDRVGWLTYDVPRRKADKIYVQRMEVEPEHKGNGYAGQLMDEMQRRHPNTPIDHGDRTPEGQAWWNSYTQDKSVRRGRTIAHHTAAVNTRCQTPGAQFHTTISGPQVGIMVDLPMTPDLNESQAELLESNMHNAMELVLRPYFDGNQRFTAAIEEDDDAGSVDRHDSDVVESAGAQEPEEVAGDETPASCSYCGSDSFTNLTDNGRVRQATCAVCGGTMSAHPGAQWTPELIGDPSNHPSPNPDPRSGGVGGAGAAATDPLVRDQSRIGAYEGPTSGEIHRGMVVDLAPHERAKFDSAGPEARARILTGKQPHAGMHWTDDEDTATSWAHHPDAAEPEPDHTRFHVVMHAEHPGVEHAFQGDRSPRNRQSIFPYGQEWETPLHPGAPVNLHGVSWLDSRSPGYEPEHAADWTMHPEEAWEHHSLQQPIKRYAKLTDPEMHEALTRFGHNHQTGQQHPHREHTLTPVKHAGFKGYVEGYEGHHEDMKQADRDLGDDHESGGDDDFDDELHEATAPDPNTHEQAHHEEHGEYPDSYYERHDEAYAKAKQDKEDAVRPVAHHGAAHNMLANEMERNYPAWHTKGEIKKVDLSKHDVYAMQPHVVDRHINRYLKNPGDTVAHVQEHGMSLAQDMYPGTHRPMFIKHENNLFTVEGHHRTASALLRKEPVEAHVYDADKHGFPHYDEDEDYGDGFDKHEGLQKHSMLMGADCDFDIEDPREAHQHALRHHDDGVCTLTEAARHKSGSTPKTAGRYERTSPTGWHYDTSISGRTKVTNPSGETTEHYNDLMGSGIKQHRHHEDMPVPLYHGMNRPLEGDQIEPGRPGNFVKRMKHVYMTEDPNEARNYAGAKGTVYEVQPTGWYGHRSDAKGLNWASEHPLNIVREVPHEESPGYEAGTGKLKEAAADGPDWCTWRQAAQCTFPNDRNNTLLAIPQVRGACPWTTRYQQQLCPISEPGPMALMQTKGSIPAGPCDTCKGKGTVSWNDEDPDWKGEPEDNPGKTFTEPCDDCDGKGHVPEISDEEIAQQKRDVEERQLVQRQQVSKHVRSEHPDRSKPPTWDEVKSCPRSCPVANEYSRNRHGSLEVTALSWDEIGDRHPHVYGDSEIHGDAADGADGPGIGDAANYLAHERPGHLDAEDSSVHDMHFREETVHPRHIDYSPSGVNDPRVRSAREGYQQHPNEMPPLVLVKRHNVYQVADGHHRAEAAHGLDMPVNAYVADSPHNDEPFADDERAPFHRAEPIAKTAMPSRKHPVPEGIQADDDDLDPNEYENEQTHPGWDHRTLYARFPHDNAPAGFINYSRTPEGHSNPAVAIHMIKTYDDHKGKGVAAYLMDHLREQHPNHMFDHGAKSPSGKGFWNSYDDPGDPKLNLDHPDNEHLKDTYRPTEEARWRADKDLSYMGTLSIPQAYELAKVARQDSEMAFHVTAAWSDVRNKAKRIRAEGKVMIKAATSEGLAGVVEGDSGAYDNMITYRPGTRKIADWSCDCKWGEWAWDRSPAACSVVKCTSVHLSSEPLKSLTSLPVRPTPRSN